VTPKVAPPREGEKKFSEATIRVALSL